MPLPPREFSQESLMATTRYDVIGIGNAIVDVIARTEEDFLLKQGMNKGTMALIDEPRAATRQSRPAGRGAHDPASPQAHRRCRHCRVAERREVDPDLAHLRGQAEDRRLSFHHA